MSEIYIQYLTDNRCHPDSWFLFPDFRRFSEIEKIGFITY
jgi:hypothetical protein